MNEIVSLKNIVDDFIIEFDVFSSYDIKTINHQRQIRITDSINNIDAQLINNQNKINVINSQIQDLTNHAEGFDYLISVLSGIFAGAIDSVFVGEFSLERADNWGNDKINKFVMRVAKMQGYNGDDLSKAVKFLEDKYPLAADRVTSAFGGGKQHHLRDFSHHPTPVGLFFSLLTQFTGKVYGTDTAGRFLVIKADELAVIGKDIPQKILFGTVYWFFHMVSDMAGSNSSISKGSKGTGLPGPLVSFLKEISCLPFFKKLNKDGNKEFSVWISKLFNGTLLGYRDENGKLIPRKFDLRTEIGITYELGRQAIPVLINECIVRGFYFINRLYKEIKLNNIDSIIKLDQINIQNVIPYKNRTINRMLTISSGTFTAIDLADASIRSAIKSGGFNHRFLGNFILSVNFVGIGRFAVAVYSDVKMEIQRELKRNERIDVYNEMLHLYNAKLFYKQAEMWMAAQNTALTIEKVYKLMERTTLYIAESDKAIHEDMLKISEYAPKVDKKNKGLRKELLDILK